MWNQSSALFKVIFVEVILCFGDFLCLEFVCSELQQLLFMSFEIFRLVRLHILLNWPPEICICAIRSSPLWLLVAHPIFLADSKCSCLLWPLTIGASTIPCTSYRSGTGVVNISLTQGYIYSNNVNLRWGHGLVMTSSVYIYIHIYTFISIYIYTYIYIYILSHHWGYYLNLRGQCSLPKLPLKSVHEWVITSHQKCGVIIYPCSNLKQTILVQKPQVLSCLQYYPR